MTESHQTLAAQGFDGFRGFGNDSSQIVVREILAEAFRELAGSKPVDKITVPNIIENCGYSKTTFYRLFKDKYDLMAWDYAQRLQAIVALHEVRGDIVAVDREEIDALV